MPKFIDRALDRLQEATGSTVVPVARMQQLVEAETSLRRTSLELDHLGWSVLNYFDGRPGELTPRSRRSMVQKARVAWMNDPTLGRAVDLRNDFTFGRGMPRPTAKDALVQDVIDRAWSHPDAEAVLTTHDAQLQRGTDLALQSNLFFVLFDDGSDGEVRLGLIDHDLVEDVVTDPENDQRVLWFVVQQPRAVAWDFNSDRPKVRELSQTDKPMYYEHWRNVAMAEEDREKAAAAGVKMEPLEKPPEDRVARGKVLHISVNKHGGQKFGVPEMQRTLRWASAMNEYLKGRVDVMHAAAAFAMKRKVKGSPAQIARDAARMVSRSSPIAGVTGTDEMGPQGPARPGSVLVENENVSWEPFRVGTGAAEAEQDVRMLRAQVSSGTGWPQHYLGAASETSLATASAMELPVLRAVERLQELFEGVVRWFVDRAIEKALEDGVVSLELGPDEMGQAMEARGWRWFKHPKNGDGMVLCEAIDAADSDEPVPVLSVYYDPALGRLVVGDELTEDVEDEAKIEAITQRDLSYEFSLPSPLRRQMRELVSAVSETARTFDPTNANVELSRVLLQIIMAEALEVADPADVVERVFPPGFQPSGSEQPPAGAQEVTNLFQPGATGAVTPLPDAGAMVPTGPDGNAYGAPMNATPPGKVRTPQTLLAAVLEEMLREQHATEVGGDLSEPLRSEADGRRVEVEDEFRDVTAVAREELLSLGGGE